MKLRPFRFRRGSMKIIEVRPQGYCGGVMNAIKKVIELRKQRPNEKITVLGSLVHNRYVKKALEELNIETIEAKNKTRLDLLDEVNDGIVVFTAHGISDEVSQKAEEKKLEVLDASCPFVLSTQNIVKDELEKGSVIFYIGKKGHPEAEAVVSSSERIYLVEKPEDIPEGVKEPVFVTNQTTMSILEIESLFKEILKKYPQASIHDEICSATRIRQQAILNLKDENPDVLIVVGDPSSNNTRKLADIGKKAGIPEVISIETAADLDLSHFKPDSTVAITSGASTPTSLRRQVQEKLASGTEPEILHGEDLLQAR